MEISVPKSRRLYRPISVSAVPAGPSNDIWRSCRFLGAMLRALGGLPGGLGRFLPCRIGANHCRLRSIGWERCGHGLTSRPLEASDAGFLDDLLSLFGYPAGSGQSLVDGSLRMRYCSVDFSRKRFGVDLWEQPIPKRWRADVFRDVCCFSWAKCQGCAFWGRFVSFG